MGYTIYSQVQCTGPFGFMGRTLDFYKWAFTMIVFSVLNHMDVATNGFFLATTMSAPSCDNMDELDQLWRQVLEQSAFSHLGPEALGKMTIANIAFWFWTLTFLQPLIAFMVSFPLFEAKTWQLMSPWSVTYKPAMNNGSYVPKVTYRTLHDDRQNHGNALMAVAEVARMGAVTYRDLEFAMSKFKLALQVLKVEPTQKRALECLHHSHGLYQRSTFRFFFQGFLESSLQLQLQVTLLGIQRAATGDRMRAVEDTGIIATFNSLNHQTLFTIGVSLLMAIKRVIDVRALFVAAKAISEETKNNDLTDCTIRDVVSEYYAILTRQIYCYLGTTVFIMSLAYAFAKYWAVFYCQSSLWNLALYPPNGCVDLS